MRTLKRRISRLIRGQKSTNTIEENLEQWENHDWSQKGEEWSNNEEWKASVEEHVLIPHIPQGSRVLEIGPGGGRWTEHLLRRADHVTVVDLTEKCIELCKERFSTANNISYFVNDGRDLSFVEPGSIDRVWSWDVFVHIRPEDIREYVRQFAKLLAPGGQALIHHASQGARRRGWRSDMTAEKMIAYCDEFGMQVLRQFDTWGNTEGEGQQYRIWPSLAAGEGPDVVSLLEKPNSTESSA